MKNVFLLILSILVLSCKGAIEVYSLTEDSQVAPVQGYELEVFFNNNNSMISRIKGKEAIREIGRIKDSLSLKGYQSPYLVGVYYYAIVVNRDTLYTNSNLTSWRYYNKTGKFSVSEELKRQILDVK